MSWASREPFTLSALLRIASAVAHLFVLSNTLAAFQATLLHAANALLRQTSPRYTTVAYSVAKPSRRLQ